MARRRVDQLHQQLERRGLARSVRSEEAECLASFDVEVDPVHGNERTEPLYESASMHQRQVCACIHHSANLPAAAGVSAVASVAMQAAVAGGHPATVAAGIEILEVGGNAADAAVASSLASCVAETVMTGLLGGGHAMFFDSATGRARNLDCFVAVPGLGEEERDAELIHLDVPFGAELVHYAVGPASCAVPGLPAGLEALSREHGRLPWRRLVEPARRRS